jgi:hypothetical protein
MGPGILYMCGQTLGAALAGGVLAGIWGYARSIEYIIFFLLFLDPGFIVF